MKSAQNICEGRLLHVFVHRDNNEQMFRIDEAEQAKMN